MKYLQLITQCKAFEQVRQDFCCGVAKHAYLIQCADSLLGMEFARVCAALTLCNNSGCLTCSDCRTALRGEHADMFVVPQSGKINVKSVNALIEQTAVIGLSGKQVFVVDGTYAVREDWQNKLLKTLEEPANGTTIFLVCTDANHICPTVRSRTVLVDVGTIDIDTIVQYFKQRGFVDNVQLAAQLSQGRIALCEQFLMSGVVMDMAQTAIVALSSLTGSKDALNSINMLSKYRDQLQMLIIIINQVLSQALKAKTNATFLLINELRSGILTVSENYSAEALALAIEVVDRQYNNLQHGFNATMVLDQMVLKIAEVKNRCRL